jgi:sulfoxide reductase heme-binding subunit YedZ
MTAAATASTTLAGHSWWLASRASGLVALALVTASVIVGLIQAGRFAAPGLRRKLSSLHEHLALTGLVAIAVHGITLLGDPWLNPGVGGIAVPFTMAFKPLWTGLGIVGGYLAAILGLSFYLRRRIGPRLWRRAHQLTVVVYALAVAHTLGAGTDATTPWLRGWIAITAPTILVLFVARVRAGRAASRARRTPAGRPRPEMAIRAEAVPEEGS